MKHLSLPPITDMLQEIANHKQEHVICVTLDGALKVIAKHTVFIGTLDCVPFHPREIFKCAIKDSAASVVIAHNHPSGLSKPSDEDIERTQQLISAGLILGIPLRDHIIIAREEHYSFLTSGFLFTPTVQQSVLTYHP